MCTWEANVRQTGSGCTVALSKIMVFGVSIWSGCGIPGQGKDSSPRDLDVCQKKPHSVV